MAHQNHSREAMRSSASYYYYKDKRYGNYSLIKYKFYKLLYKYHMFWYCYHSEHTNPKHWKENIWKDYVKPN